MLRFFALVAVLVAAPALHADDWPQWLGPKRDGVWRETGLIETFPAGGPKIKWRAPVAAGYSGPAVAKGRVYLTDRVLAKDAKNPDSPFSKDLVQGKERILCFDEAKGTLLWQYEYDCPYTISYPSGPRTTPVVEGNRVYTLGAMGDLVCMDTTRPQKPVWHKKLLDEYKFPAPYWGFAGHPLLDGDRLICLVGGKGSVVVAFHKEDGRELWKNLTASEPGYCPPMIYEIGGKRQLIVWHPDSVNALEPDTGKLYWSHPFKGTGKKGSIRAGMTIPTPRLTGDLLFLTCFYDGAMLLKTKGTETPDMVWRSKSRGEMPDDTDALHSVMSTPVIKNGYIYGTCSYGELRCVELMTGKRLWETHQYTSGKSMRWGNAFLVENGDRFVLFDERGNLILAKFSPQGHQEIARAKILEPTNHMAKGRAVVWSHPAFANRCVFARNDVELVCVDMAK